MSIKEVLQEKTWEKFLLKQPHTPFLQSWAWGEFQEKLGLSSYRFGLYSESSLAGVCLALVGRRKLGSFVYVPHGPVLEKFNKKEVRTVLNYLKDFAKREGVDYLRIEPKWEANEDTENFLTETGFRKAQAATGQGGGRTLLLDLHPFEKDLFAKMRKSTRQRIRQGREVGVEVKRSRDPGMIAEFYRLMVLTSHRQGFTPHSLHYLQTQFEVLASRGMIELYLAEYQGDILAAGIIITYGDTATHVHGGSVKSKIPASHFLRWKVIKRARKVGVDFYDSRGIASTDDSRHPWYGYTHFKKGFGGYPVDYVGTWDCPLSPRYLAVSAVEQVRKLIRRY